MNEKDNTKDITKDVQRFSKICRQVGYLGALAERSEKFVGNELSKKISEYITELFLAKREVEVE